jgi:hypothetical protein
MPADQRTLSDVDLIMVTIAAAIATEKCGAASA